MLTALVVAAGVLGLLVGSFLNVVIWRVPRGESVVRPPSACPRCGNAVRPRDNVPVISWLLLRGRCRDCGELISRRYPVVELVTGVLFAVTAAVVGLEAHLLAFLYLAAISVALTLIDIDVHRLPNAIVLPSYVVGAVLLGVPSLLEGEHSQLLRAGIGLVVLWLLYFLLLVIYPAGMGFGDVKLAGVLGMYLAWLGWGQLLVGAFAAFLVGGLVGAVLMVVGRAGRKTRIPFGPYMIAGAYIGAVAGDPVWSWYLGSMGL